jgi:hypothetical protein
MGEATSKDTPKKLTFVVSAVIQESTTQLHFGAPVDRVLPSSLDVGFTNDLLTLSARVAPVTRTP